MSKDDKHLDDVLQRIETNLEKSLGRIESSVNDLKERVDTLSDTDNSQSIDELKKFLQDENDKVRKKLEDDLSECKKTIHSLENDNKQLSEKLDKELFAYKETIQSLDKEKANLLEMLKNEKLSHSSDSKRYEDEYKKLEQQKSDCDAKVSSLQDEISKLSEVVEDVKQNRQREAEDAKTTISTLEKEIQDKEEEMLKLLKKFANALLNKNEKVEPEKLVGEIKKLKEMLELERNKVKDLSKQSAEKDAEITSLKQTTKDNSRTISELSDEVKNSNKAVEALNKDVDSKNAKISDLNKTVEKLQNEVSKLNSDIESDKVNIQGLSDRITEFESCEKQYKDAVSPFLEIYKLMQKCPSMKWLLEEKFLLPATGELSITQQVQFVNVFSDEIYFAQEVYKAMEAYKRGNYEQLTDNEREFIRKLNEYYKTVFTIEHNILDCLNIEEGTDFNSKSMKLIDRPTSTFSSKAKYLCVPALRWLDENHGFAQKAYIMGD